MLKIKVISLPYVFQVLYVLCFTRPRYQVSVYRTIGPLVFYVYATCKDDISYNGWNTGERQRWWLSVYFLKAINIKHNYDVYNITLYIPRQRITSVNMLIRRLVLLK